MYLKNLKNVSVQQMVYITYVCMPKRQIPYLTSVEKVTLVHWCMLFKPFLCMPTKYLITWRMPLFSCSVRLVIIKSSINLFKSFLLPS